MDNSVNALNSIDVLIVVDVVGALASGNLSNNVYLVDTNKYMGSWNQGHCELGTVCHDTQRINWRVVPISPSTNVSIIRFTGEIISKQVCVPTKQGEIDDEYWTARMQSRGVKTTYQYACVLSMNGKEMTFDPYIKVI